MIERLRSDLIDAVRALVATPVTTFATVLLLAVAVGANLAVFGLIDRAILTPTRHVVRPDRLFTLAFEVPNDASPGAGMTTTSYVAFDTLREHAPSIAGIAAWRRTSTTVIVSGEQARAEAMLVSGSYFAVLGAVPQLGRAIEPADDQVSSGAAVISHAFWRSVFGGDPGVLGRRITVNRIEYVVAGVMPAGFSGHSATRVDIWVPLAAAMRDTPGWNRDGFRNVVSIIARVEPGADGSCRRPGERGPRASRLARQPQRRRSGAHRTAHRLRARRRLVPRPRHRARERGDAAARARHAAPARVGHPHGPRGDARTALCPDPARGRDPCHDGDGRCVGAVNVARRGRSPVAPGGRDRERGSHAPEPPAGVRGRRRRACARGRHGRVAAASPPSGRRSRRAPARTRIEAAPTRCCSWCRRRCRSC